MTLRVHLPETVVDGMRLGRHVLHDAASWLFPAPMASEIRTVDHVRHVPIYEQGTIGRCTGCALAGTLSSGDWPHRLSLADATRLYSEATRIDPIPGTYPPTDTGSNGLSVAKAAHDEGLVGKYFHAFGQKHALRALTLAPGILGMLWRTGCDRPDPDGTIHYDGSIRGGHEVSVTRVDVEGRRVGGPNSWGTTWGAAGWWWMSWNDLAAALADAGDVVVPWKPKG